MCSAKHGHTAASSAARLSQCYVLLGAVASAEAQQQARDTWRVAAWTFQPLFC